MTKKYIGTKIITAFQQGKDGKPGYGVIYEDGYQSWSPKETFFEKAYRAIEERTRPSPSATPSTCSSWERRWPAPAGTARACGWL